MATFTTEDGRRIPFIDWPPTVGGDVPRIATCSPEETEGRDPYHAGPQCIAANELLDRDLVAFIQG